MSANASVTQSREQTGGFQNLKERKKKTQKTSKPKILLELLCLDT